MKRLDIGRIKTGVLILLVISSLILSGNLWFEDYHGFSAFFTKIGNTTSRFIHGTNKNLENKYQQIFVPLEIIVNDGEQGHWILYPSQPQFNNLWESLKTVLKDIVASKTFPYENIDKSEWDGLLTKRSLVIKFGYPLSNEIISLLFKINTTKLNEMFVNVDEIALIRLGENLILYTRGKKTDRDVYQKFYYSNRQVITDKDLEDVFNDTRLLKYTLLREAFANMKLGINYEERVFMPMFSFSGSRKSMIKLKGIEFKSEITPEHDRDINNLAEEFFQGRDYAKFIKNDGTYIFIDEKNNTLKIYPDGLMEFETGEGTEIKNDDVGFSDALRTALNMVERFGGLDTLYLTGFYASKGQYVFKLDYAIDGVPVVTSRGGKIPGVENAVEISVGKGKIRFKRFTPEFKSVNEYDFSIGSENLIDLIYEKIGSTNTNINIQDIKLVYRTDLEKQSVNFPVWLVRYEINGRKMQMDINLSK